MARASSHTATAAFIVGAAGIAGVALVALGATQFSRNADFVARALPAAGTVIAYDRPGGDAMSAAPLTPIVRYQLNKADVRDLRPEFVASWRGYDIGERLTVLYDPQDPTKALIDDFWQLWFLPVLCGVTGLAMIVVPLSALGLAISANRRDRQAAA